MFKEQLEAYTISIVLVGDFNPPIIQPFWLSNRKLIREQEAQNAKVDVIHNEISKFSVDWATFEITRDRFEIRTSQDPYFEPLKDLIIEIFKVLRETPIRSIGINHLRYFDLRDSDRHYNFGNKLAPLSYWSDDLNDPRLLNLEIVETKRKDGLKGQYRVKVQPPDIKLSTNYGVLININDHVDFENGKALDVFNELWKPSFARAEEISENIWEKVTK